MASALAATLPAGCSSDATDTTGSAVDGTGGRGGTSSEGGATTGGAGGTSIEGGASTGGADGGSGLVECPTTMPDRQMGIALASLPGADASTGLLASEEIHGTLLSAVATKEPCGPYWSSSSTCQTDALRLEIEEGDAGPPRAFVVASASTDGWKDTLTRSVGSAVTLSVRHARGFQWSPSSGFVLRDEKGILMAAELGPFVRTLPLEDLPGVQVTTGADLCVRRSSCGDFVATELVFHGDTMVSVDRTSDGQFVSRSLHYSARNIGGGRVVPNGCQDLEAVSTWAFWRNDP